MNGQKKGTKRRQRDIDIENGKPWTKRGRRQARMRRKERDKCEHSLLETLSEQTGIALPPQWLQWRLFFLIKHSGLFSTSLSYLLGRHWVFMKVAPENFNPSIKPNNS